MRNTLPIRDDSRPDGLQPLPAGALLRRARIEARLLS